MITSGVLEEMYELGASTKTVGALAALISLLRPAQACVEVSFSANGPDTERRQRSTTMPAKYSK